MNVPSSVRKWIAFVVSLSVGVALGLGPFLGKVSVPGFVPLLQILPDQERSKAVIFSSFLMGLVATSVHFFADLRPRLGRLRMFFLSALAATFASFLALFLVYESCTESLTVPGAGEASFVVGCYERPSRCSQLCDPALSNAACIKILTFDPAQIAGCYGDRSIKTSTAELLLLYMLVLASFGALVGIATYRRRR